MNYNQFKDTDMENDISVVQPLNNGQVEQEHIVLPCDMFRNRVTHYAWVLTRSTLFKIMFIIMVLCIATLFLSSNVVVLAIAGCTLYFDGIALVIHASIQYSYKDILKRISLRDQMVFFGEIVKYRPNSDPKTWNIIGSHMDQFFAKEGVYFPLYNGQDYFHLFSSMTSIDKCINNGHNDTNGANENMEAPTLLDDTLTLNSNLDTPANNNNNDNNNSNNNSNSNENINDSTLMYLDKAKRKAQLVFQETENEYWLERYPELAA
ncbi:hypothetical protein C6P45_000597 [Maudiozyma exigua]|uniref:Uncharacterized protein n=1 Tax=Maudiozyma exigua TaxID=34358 RepID=A0A9P7BD72_MAUEX|nr:hypothetical protein C6P45_000597 [Kazachstania exigua]